MNLIKAFGLLTLASSPILGFASKKTKEEKPNLIFILCDQWRRQSIGVMGEDPVHTPNIDKFANESSNFTHAVACRPVSGPNRACLFTGKYPINNGVFANNVPLDPKEDASLGKICKTAGYRTGYIGKWHLNGLEDPTLDPARRQGFDFWYQSIGHAPFNQGYVIKNNPQRQFVKGWAPSHETQVAIDYIEKDKNNPFCLVISYNPPHTGGSTGFEDRYQPGKKNKDGSRKYGYGYAGPKEYEARYDSVDYAKNKIRPNIKTIRKSTDECYDAIPGYFGAITAIDKDFGDLIDYLEKNDLAENTIIVFTSDHGEAMGSQGLMTKGTWFEESIGVPCIIGWPNGVKPQTRPEVFNSIDLMPTLLGLMDLTIPKGVDGTDFSPLLLGKRGFKAPKYAYLSFDFGGVAEVKAPRYWRALYSDRYTYALAGINQNRSFTKDGYVLYDREKDPYQLKPIYKGMGYDKVIEELHEELESHLDETGDPFITSYWHNDKAGLPKLNKYTISHEEIMRNSELTKKRLQAKEAKAKKQKAKNAKPKQSKLQ